MEATSIGSSMTQVVGIGVIALLSYLLGSLNFGVLLSRGKDQGDVRNFGSGNSGMTNVLRVYGKNLAIATAVGDGLKAVLAVVLAREMIGPHFGVGTIVDPGYIAGLFALMGHIYPIFFEFKGGKGVMTSIGIIAVLDPFVLLLLIVVGLPIILKTRIVSLASITCAGLFPIFTLIIRLITHRSWKIEVLFALIIGGIVIYVHRENIQRLRAGTENRFEKSSKNE